MDIEKIKNNYFYAVDLIEERIKEELEAYGDEGIELNSHPEEDCFSVTEEIEPNEFKVITKVRVHYDELQVIVEGENEWSSIMGITDWVFFLDEVINTIDGIYE